MNCHKMTSSTSSQTHKIRAHRYYIIAGEASGDLHASHLVAALRRRDPQAEFRGFGGEKMEAEGVTLVRHYRDLAYMGFVQVVLHLSTILDGLRQCRDDIAMWQPDVLILVDYPGFNLKIAKHIKQHTNIPIYYYISPKIWAWKEGRIKALRRDVDCILSILPFEVDYFRQRHQYEVTYVGNPSADEVVAYESHHPRNWNQFVADNQLSGKPVIGLLAGSRKQEIKDNLRRMLEAAKALTDRYELVLAAAPGFDDEAYQPFLDGTPVRILHDQTFRILQHSTAALVTSGTATLETALFGVPQVVCYYVKGGKFTLWAKRHLLKVPYISLVNLIANAPVVPELVASMATPSTIRQHLIAILPDGEGRDLQLQGYAQMRQRLGETAAAKNAAKHITQEIWK